MKTTLITWAIILLPVGVLSTLGFYRERIIIHVEVNKAAGHVVVWPNMAIPRSPGIEEWLEIKDSQVMVKPPINGLFHNDFHKQAWENTEWMSHINQNME